MEFIMDILNATVKAHGRDTVVQAVETWLALKKAEKFLEENPGMSFGNAPVVRQRALSADAPEYTPVVRQRALSADAQEYVPAQQEDGLALLAEAVATVEVEDELERLAAAVAESSLSDEE